MISRVALRSISIPNNSQITTSHRKQNQLVNIKMVVHKPGKSHLHFSTMPQPQDLKNNKIQKKITVLDIQKKFTEKKPLTMVTAYDYTSATLVDKAGIDMILVGDSLGMVMLGYTNTTAVTVEDMLHHCKAVTRGAKSSFIVGDMPFGSYEGVPQQALANAIRLVKEGGAEAVKMEGGKRIKDSVKAVVSAGIPVIGHIGLTPQSINALGGFKVQGKTAEAARQLLEDAKELENCGVIAIVIESVPEAVATYITNQLKVPTIGIGAGVGTSGQVLVFHDMLGMYPNFVPKFCKQYAKVGETIEDALKDYKNEVESRTFPTAQHTYSIKVEELHKAFPELANATATNKETEITQSTITPTILSKNYKKNIAIVGAGAMGSLIGGKLAATNNYNVWMLSSWKEHVEKINREGLTMLNVDKTSQKIPVHATTSIEEILERCNKIDLAMVLVKSQNTKLAAEKAAKLLSTSKDGLIVTLQNGMGNREIIAEALGDESRVIQGITSHGSTIMTTGKVSHTGVGPTSIAFNQANFHAVKEIAEMLTQAGIPCEMVQNLESMLWGKLIVNAGINPLTALLRIKNGEIVNNTWCKDVLYHTVKEGVSVADAKGVPLPYDNPLESVLNVARATSENISSMLADVLRGTSTEIDSINGAIVKEGEKLGVGVSVNRTLVDLVSSIAPAKGFSQAGIQF